MKIKMPIKVISEANRREHWTVRNRRRRSQQQEFAALWRGQSKPKLPCRVVFTRHASRLLDSDNLAGAFKFVRDQLAWEIGVDDGSDLLHFEYRQEKLATRDYYISIEIVEADKEAESGL